MWTRPQIVQLLRDLWMKLEGGLRLWISEAGSPCGYLTIRGSSDQLLLFVYPGACQRGGDGIGIRFVSEGIRVKSVWTGRRVDERYRGAANAVSHERVGHINVDDVVVGGIHSIRVVDSLLGGGIELINCRVDRSIQGIDGLKQMRIASHYNQRLRRRVCYVGIQVCEILAERRQYCEPFVDFTLAIGRRLGTDGEQAREIQVGGTNGQGHQPGTSIQRSQLVLHLGCFRATACGIRLQMDALFRVKDLWITRSGLQAAVEVLAAPLSCRIGVTQRNVLDSAGLGCSRHRANCRESCRSYHDGYQTRQQTPPSTHRRETIALSQLMRESPPVRPTFWTVARLTGASPARAPMPAGRSHTEPVLPSRARSQAHRSTGRWRHAAPAALLRYAAGRPPRHRSWPVRPTASPPALPRSPIPSAPADATTAPREVEGAGSMRARRTLRASQVRRPPSPPAATAVSESAATIVGAEQDQDPWWRWHGLPDPATHPRQSV